MSALGGLPGYAYPTFDYGATEFAEFTQPGFTVAVAGNFTIDVATAGHNGALRVQTVATTGVTGGAVGVRTVDLDLLDGDGNVVTFSRQTLQPGASTFVGFQWLTTLSTSYSVAGDGFSPMADLVIPPGWRWQISYFNLQIGDVINGASAVGSSIPAQEAGARQPPSTAPVLLT